MHKFLLVLAVSLVPSTQLRATIIYANNAGTDQLEKIDSTTGAVLDSFTALAADGRGVVTVGNTVYFTTADNNNVYSANLTTHALNGIAFRVAGATGLSTLAYDGSNFWIGDYSGTNKAYLYSPSGALLKTITLSNAASFYDGLEFFNGKLIANRFDGGLGGTNTYDVYDTNGNLLQAAFITTSQAPAATGIAYDGTNFWIAGVSDGKLYEYDGTTGAFISSIQVTGTHTFEDLSVDYSLVIPPNAPEPGTFVLMAGGLLAAAAVRLRRKK